MFDVISADWLQVREKLKLYKNYGDNADEKTRSERAKKRRSSSIEKVKPQVKRKRRKTKQKTQGTENIN